MEEMVTNHSEAVSNPQTVPAVGTVGHVRGLTVYGDDVSRDVAHYAATDVRANSTLFYGHHGYGGSGGQPVGLIVSAGVVTHVVEVTENEWHGAETL